MQDIKASKAMKPGQVVQYASGFIESTGMTQDYGHFLSYHDTLGDKYCCVDWDVNGIQAVCVGNIRPVRSGPSNLSYAKQLFMQEASTAGQIHGSVLRDIFAELGVEGCIWDQDDTILRDMVLDNTVTPIMFKPTHSQCAFLGLQFNASFIKKIKSKVVSGKDPGSGLRSACLYRFNK